MYEKRNISEKELVSDVFKNMMPEYSNYGLLI